MFRRIAVMSAIAGIVALCASAHADVTLKANLTNSGESPAAVPTLTNGQPRPASFGTATFVLNDSLTQMTMSVEVFNIDFGPVTGTAAQTADINDNLTVAHIHGGDTATPTFGVVWGFIGTPFNDTNPTNVVVTPFASGVGGTVTSIWNQTEGQGTNTLTNNIDRILNGRTYINFHTTQFGGGEIRGTLVVIPEPASLGALGVGALALLARRRRA